VTTFGLVLMVLVSKLRSSPSVQQPAGANSFLGKIRSTFARTASSTSLQHASSDVGPLSLGAKVARSLFFSDKLDESNNVEKFDGSSDDTSSGRITPVSECPDPCSHPADNYAVMLGDLQKKLELAHINSKTTTSNCKQIGLASSICGSHCHENAPVTSGGEQFGAESEFDIEPVSLGLATHMKLATEVRPGATSTDERSQSKRTASSASESRSHLASQTEVPGRLWEPSDPPALAPPAWQLKRETDLVPVSHRTRFPSRLPPLSGLGTKSLRRLTGGAPSATTVVKVEF
jgi:hypothetical protein